MDTDRHSRKSETRNPKSETNPNSWNWRKWRNEAGVHSAQHAKNLEHYSTEKTIEKKPVWYSLRKSAQTETYRYGHFVLLGVVSFRTAGEFRISDFPFPPYLALVPERQLHLFAASKPLLERLGPAFFRDIPAAPGIYIMSGANQRVLYIGQSRNLRARLGSYKNAQPDRAPRKVIRLIHQVDSIVWERCATAAAARLRENELLRVHRPQFNRANVYPRAYSFLWVEHGPAGTELGRSQDPEALGQVFGAFKGGALPGYNALLRLLWAVLHQPCSPQDFPRDLLGVRPPRRFRFGPGLPSHLLEPLLRFLEGTSDSLLQVCTEALPRTETISPFQRALHQADLETLESFFRAGPRRNHELKVRHQLAGRVISQDSLDDLLVPRRP